MSDPVAAIRTALAAVGDPNRAARQQAYVKSALPYRGLSAPDLARLLRPILLEHRLDSRTAWEAAARELWDGATYREEWYAAIALLRHRHYRAWVDPDLLPLLRHLVETGAWWDVVDEVAAHLVGGVLAACRAEVTPVVRDWGSDDHLWVRRTAVLSQLTHKQDTDTGLLDHVLAANLEGSPYGSEFFVRKAVGWALRAYGAADPAWVLDWVARHEDRLSGLSRREALKHLQ